MAFSVNGNIAFADVEDAKAYLAAYRVRDHRDEAPIIYQIPRPKRHGGLMTMTETPTEPDVFAEVDSVAAIMGFIHHASGGEG